MLSNICVVFHYPHNKSIVSVLVISMPSSQRCGVLCFNWPRWAWCTTYRRRTTRSVACAAFFMPLLVVPWPCSKMMINGYSATEGSVEVMARHKCMLHLFPAIEYYYISYTNILYSIHIQCMHREQTVIHGHKSRLFWMHFGAKFCGL